MAYLVSALVVAGFGYFIYARIEASRDRRANRPEGSGGSGGGTNPNVHKK